ncbi:EF-hand domain-containing protein [Limnoglobus roseus]|uniref:Calmodulin n=1 Tax=Limnoglobus roseus TaxID=2598579 RepID=A0A5C1ANL6_9BACT|nr:EF-hand domain-containing protein [Limnoglobus roseus]QEL19596.1 calmodulin [Limnoglobus roseus]
MIRRTLAALLFAAVPVAAADRPPAVDLVLLGGAKPARVQVEVEVDGKPLPAVWDETFAKLVAFYDRDGDGKLDKVEAARLPAPLAVRQAMGMGFIPPVGEAPMFADLDADKDGHASAAEVAAFYRRSGFGQPLIGIGSIPATADLTAALLKHLDADGDGTLSAKEWKDAAETLAKLDKNDDELIGANELVPQVVYPGAAGTILLTPPDDTAPTVEAVAKFPALRLPTEVADLRWAAEITRRGGPALPAAWRTQEPAGRWAVKFGAKDAAARVVVAGARFEGWTTSGKLPELLATTRKQLQAQLGTKPEPSGERPAGRRRGTGGLDWLTPIADRDGDGTLSEKELNAWLDLQQQVGRGHALITLLDAKTGLFELLDANHDGTLSVRELRRAWEVVTAAGIVKDGRFDRERVPRQLLAAASLGYPQSFGTDLRAGPAWFRAMDKNGDGDVSRKEFTGPAEAFDKLDTDKDGLLSSAEAEKTEPKK